MRDPLGFDAEFANSPLSRAEAYMLTSKLKRMILATSQVAMATREGSGEELLKAFELVRTISSEIEPLMEGLLHPGHIDG